MEIKENIVILTRQEYDDLIRLIETLKCTVVKLESIIKEQALRIKELEGIIHKNSSNSSKPPSSDGLRKPLISNREKSNKPNGGQKGHEGNTLKMVKNPDKIIQHKVKGRCECGADLEKIQTQSTLHRQVFDLPEKLYEVTEHQVEVKQCSCGKVHVAECPVQGVTQYGEKIKALLSYLNIQQFIPYARLQEIMHDLFSLPLGGGTIESANENLHTRLEETEQQIKQGLMESEVIHNDETGVRCEGKTQWVHNTSNEKYTHYHIHPKRGKEGVEAIGILPHYNGTSVHDRWATYFLYSCTHALCNAHLLRELKFIWEEAGKKWALSMIRLLVLAHYMKKRNWLTPPRITLITQRYRQIVAQAQVEEPVFTTGHDPPHRGRKAKSKSMRLMEAFQNYEAEVLRFVHCPQVPFDNNLAERDLRMVKLKQKISGCFRTQHGAEVFCRIRGYISTVRKQGYIVLDAIRQALSGSPVVVYQCT